MDNIIIFYLWVFCYSWLDKNLYRAVFHFFFYINAIFSCHFVQICHCYVLTLHLKMYVKRLHNPQQQKHSWWYCHANLMDIIYFLKSCPIVLLKSLYYSCTGQSAICPFKLISRPICCLPVVVIVLGLIGYDIILISVCVLLNVSAWYQISTSLL